MYSKQLSNTKNKKTEIKFFNKFNIAKFIFSYFDKIVFLKSSFENSISEIILFLNFRNLFLFDIWNGKNDVFDNKLFWIFKSDVGSRPKSFQWKLSHEGNDLIHKIIDE